MRKLKLQVNITIDGFIASPDGTANWMRLAAPDPAGIEKVIELAETSDTILMGRKMVPGFIKHWESVADAQPGGLQQKLAELMVNTKKIMFSHTETTAEGHNLQVENGDLVTVVQALKQQPGKDLLVYGGAGFVNSLITHNLIDEYYLIVNPVAIGSGMPIFSGERPLQLESTIIFKSGKVLNKYVPA